MDFDKLLQWMEYAKNNQNNDFWGKMFDQTSFQQFMKEHIDMGAMGDSSPSQTNQLYPSIDIYTTETEVIIIVDLPGYKKSDLTVSVSGSRLLLKGNALPGIAGTTFIQERKQGKIERIVNLPEPTESSQIRARFVNGQLILCYQRQYPHEQHVVIDD